MNDDEQIKNILEGFVERRTEQMMDQDEAEQLKKLEREYMENRPRSAKIAEAIQSESPHKFERNYDFNEMLSDGASSPRDIEKKTVRSMLRNRKADDLEPVHEAINAREISDLVEEDTGLLSSRRGSKFEENLTGNFADDMDVIHPERMSAEQYKKLARVAKKDSLNKVASLKRLGKGAFRKLPMVGGLLGLLGAEDASAAMPILGEADDIGTEAGTPEGRLERGEASPEDMERLLEAARKWEALNK